MGRNVYYKHLSKFSLTFRIHHVYSPIRFTWFSAWRFWAGLGRFLRRNSWWFVLEWHSFHQEVPQEIRFENFFPRLVIASEKPSEYLGVDGRPHIEGFLTCDKKTKEDKVVFNRPQEFSFWLCWHLYQSGPKCLILKTFPCPDGWKKLKLLVSGSDFVELPGQRNEQCLNSKMCKISCFYDQVVKIHFKQVKSFAFCWFSACDEVPNLGLGPN